MAFLSKGKKIDIYNLGLELRVDVSPDDKIIDLREKIMACALFTSDNQFVKDTFNIIVEERKNLEEKEEKRLEKEAELRKEAQERAFELEKLKLQAQNQNVAAVQPTPVDFNPVRFDLKTVLPTFIPDKDDMSIFLTMFERQMKLLNVSTDFWVSHLIGVLPSDIGTLIAREPEEMFKNYSHIRTILLQRFKLTAERFRVLFSRHQKRENSTWKDFYFELRNYFEGWLSELEIDSFDKLKELILADQIKKKCPPDYKNHYLDGWEKLNDPVILSEKLDLYESIKSPSQKFANLPKSREIYKPFVPRNTSGPQFKKNYFPKTEQKEVSGNYKNTFPNSRYINPRNVNPADSRPPISCYGCGLPGFIKAKCPSCSLKNDSANVNAIHMFTCFTSPVALLDIKIYEATGTVCADTGASRSVGGELMFNFLKNRGEKFTEFQLDVCLADGQKSTSTVQKATVPIIVHGRTFRTDLIFLPHAKGNRTLLGVDFLKKSGIVMDMRNNCWYFHDKPYCRIPFAKDIPLPVRDSPVEVNSSPRSQTSITNDVPLQVNPVEEAEANQLSLRKEEGQTLDTEKRNYLSVMLNENGDIFRLGGEPTPYLKKFATITNDIRERIERKQDERKLQYDKNRRQVFYSPGDKVWVNLHPHSNAKNKKTSKFMPKRDGPYLVLTKKSPTSYVIASLDKPSEPIATYHTSALTPFREIDTSPVVPLRKRGRPPKIPSESRDNQKLLGPLTQKTKTPTRRANTAKTLNYSSAVSLPGRPRSQRGRM